MNKWILIVFLCAWHSNSMESVIELGITCSLYSKWLREALDSRPVGIISNRRGIVFQRKIEQGFQETRRWTFDSQKKKKKKEHMETFGNDRYIHYLDCSDGFTNVYQNSSNCTFWYMQCNLCQLYFNKVLRLNWVNTYKALKGSGTYKIPMAGSWGPYILFLLRGSVIGWGVDCHLFSSLRVSGTNSIIYRWHLVVCNKWWGSPPFCPYLSYLIYPYQR